MENDNLNNLAIAPLQFRFNRDSNYIPNLRNRQHQKQP